MFLVKILILWKRKESAIISQSAVSTHLPLLFYLVYLFEWRSGKYISSVASNSQESLFRQIKEYAHLNEQEQADLRKFIL